MSATLCPCCGKDKRVFTSAAIFFPGAEGFNQCVSCYCGDTPEEEWTPAYAAYIKDGYRKAIGPLFESLKNAIVKGLT